MDFGNVNDRISARSARAARRLKIGKESIVPCEKKAGNCKDSCGKKVLKEASNSACASGVKSSFESSSGCGVKNTKEAIFAHLWKVEIENRRRRANSRLHRRLIMDPKQARDGRRMNYRFERALSLAQKNEATYRNYIVIDDGDKSEDPNQVFLLDCDENHGYFYEFGRLGKMKNENILYGMYDRKKVNGDGNLVE